MGDGFDAVFTKLGDGPGSIGIWPAAARAIKSLLLIDLEEGLATAHDTRFVRGMLEGSENGGDAAGACGGRVKFKVVAIFDRDVPRRG